MCGKQAVCLSAYDRIDLNELEALVVLTATPHLGPIKIRLLLQHFGSALQTLEAAVDDVKILPGFGPKMLKAWNWWRTDNSWERNFELARRYDARIIPFTGMEYPRRLLELPDHPVLLYVRGEIKPCDAQGIAVVGTRVSGVYGNEMAEKISRDLAASGFTVVSGLARGIDTAAHRGALSQGRTIAVIGSGLADIYPQENKALADHIAANGALISEFPMAAPPDRQNFPQRNRIVSGMTLGTLLIEAPVKSGAMITMDRAYAQGRRMFALPGRADCESFRGNHMLIKSGKAQLVEEARDIRDCFEGLFGVGLGQKVATVQETRIALEPEEQDFLSRLPAEELSIDAMLQLTKLPVIKLNILLMSLVLKRAIKEYPGKIYKKKG